MNRTGFRCVTASVSIHLLLLCLLFVGPAFLPSKPPPPTPIDDLAIIDFIPLKTTDDLISGGGNPKATAKAAETPPKIDPTPPPPVAKPVPEPVKAKTPEPKRVERAPEPELVRRTVPVDPDALEPVQKKPKTPDISTKIVTRQNPKANEAKERARKEAAERERREREAYEARQRLASNLSRAANSIAEGLSSSTTIELRGPGGGGVPYANFFQAVKSRYDQAWAVPDGVTDNTATVTADVTIGRDGRVLNWKITRRSGNALMDRCVEDTLYRVKHAAPLPDSEKANQRTVSIDFNARAKRARA